MNHLCVAIKTHHFLYHVSYQIAFEWKAWKKKGQDFFVPGREGPASMPPEISPQTEGSCLLSINMTLTCYW